MNGQENKTTTDCSAKSEQVETHTDCGSDVGMTVGLIDSLIFICRVLAPRLKMTCGDQEEQPIVEALRDLSQDEAVCWVWDHRPYSPDEQTDIKLLERAELHQKQSLRTDKETARLAELDEWARNLTFAPSASESRFSDKISDLVRKAARDLVK